MFSILRRRGVLVVLSCAALLVASDYFGLGVWSILPNSSLTLAPLGTDAGWLVLAITLLIVSWKGGSEPTGNTVVGHGSLWYVRVLSIGVALLALGWQISTVLIGSDEPIRRIAPIPTPIGYLVIAITLWILAVRNASHGAHGDSGHSPIKAPQLLVAAGVGIAIEGVAYVPLWRDSSWLGFISFTSAQPVGMGILGVVLLVAAKRRMAPSAPLAVLGIGLLVVMAGTGLTEAGQLAVSWQGRWLISLGLSLTGTGYVILALTAAFAAFGTRRRTVSRRRQPYERSPLVEPQGLWVR